MKVFKSETAQKHVLNTYNLLLDMWNVKFFPEVGHGINHEIADEINRLLPEFVFKDN